MRHISKNNCVGCGICGSKCPVGAISVDIQKGIAVIDQDKCTNCGLCLQNCPQNAIKDIKEELTISMGTDDSKIIKSDDHVGMSKYYLIYGYSEGEMNFKEKRENIKYQEDKTKVHGDLKKAKKVSSVLEGVDIIVGKMLGPNIKRLKNKFVCVIIREPKIKKALEIIKENINEIVEEKNKIERRGIILN